MGLSGCFQSKKIISSEKIEIHSIADEVQIPKIIMSDLQAEITSESKTIAPVYMFATLQVRFVEFNEGVLKNPSMTFVFPKGGGRIDLKDVISGSGSFYLSFPKIQFEGKAEDEPELLHFYYVSNSPVKKIDGESFGLGCGKMIDLKKSYSKLQSPDFLKLNTSEQRYLYVTAGRYVFIFQQFSKIYMSQLTITDSRYTKELCLGVSF